MAQQQYLDTIKSIYDYCGLISAADRASLRVTDADIATYEGNLSLINDYQDRRDAAKRFLASVIVEEERFRRRKGLADRGITVPSLLGRYHRLPDFWRCYVRANALDMLDEKITDLDVARMWGSFKEADLDDADDGAELADTMMKFDRALTEAEKEHNGGNSERGVPSAATQGHSDAQ